MSLETMRAERERAISDPAFIAREEEAADTMTAIRSVVDMLDDGLILDSDATLRIQVILNPVVIMGLPLGKTGEVIKSGNSIPAPNMGLVLTLNN